MVIALLQHKNSTTLIKNRQSTLCFLPRRVAQKVNSVLKENTSLYNSETTTHVPKYVEVKTKSRTEEKTKNRGVFR